jgi:alpha-tubulin suppressor-like RCC1 family protein
VRTIAAGFDHSVAVMAAGGVTTWGANGEGQLGTGNRVARSLPAYVVGQPGRPSVIRSAAAGGLHTLALRREDGGTWAWGDNAFGQIGDGTTKDRLTPARVRR